MTDNVRSNRRFYVKHEDWYLEEYDPDVTVGVTSGWTKEPKRFFYTRAEASRVARALRTGPRQFAGLGSEARVVSRRS